MPDPIEALACASVLITIPALAMAIYHGTRLEKAKFECSREHPCKKQDKQP